MITTLEPIEVFAVYTHLDNDIEAFWDFNLYSEIAKEIERKFLDLRVQYSIRTFDNFKEYFNSRINHETDNFASQVKEMAMPYYPAREIAENIESVFKIILNNDEEDS